MPNWDQKLKTSTSKQALVPWRMAELDDDDIIDETGACAVLGGGTNPIHRSTLWKGIKAGVYSPPFKTGPGDRLNRWRVGNLRADIRRAYESSTNDAA